MGLPSNEKNNKNDLVFPFTAIVGQKNLKTALILNMIDPKMANIVVMNSDRDDIKETLISFANFLPDSSVVNGNFFNCSVIQLKKLIEFDVIEHSELTKKEIKTPFKFLLISSENLERERFSSQLSSQFSFCVNCKVEKSIARRTRIVNTHLEFEKNPKDFIKKWSIHEENLYKRIIRARTILPSLVLELDLVNLICSLCNKLNLNDVRGDLVLTRAIKIAYAFELDAKPNDIVPIEFIVKANLPAMCLTHKFKRSSSIHTVDWIEDHILNFFYHEMFKFGLDASNVNLYSLYEQEEFSFYSSELEDWNLHN